MIATPPFLLAAAEEKPPVALAPSLSAAVTEHISLSKSTRMGAGGGQAAAIVLRVPSPPPRGTLPPPGGLSPPCLQTKALQPPASSTPVPSSGLSSLYSSTALTARVQPHPLWEGTADTSGAAGQQAASRPRPAAAAGGAASPGRPGWGLGVGGSTSWCGGTCCRRGRRASRNWKARSRESQT